MKGLIASIILISISSFCHGQTLFTYGPDKVSTQEFLNAYRKNNTGEDNAKAREDYLELYTRFRLKVREAYAMKLDTLSSQKADLQGFRKQIEGPYLTDNNELDRMTLEALDRSKKDIRLSHILIPYRSDYVTSPYDPRTPNAQDSAGAAKLAAQVQERLAKGEDFDKLARELSADPTAKTNGGDMGWITVFVLPYEIENAAYTLKDGGVSSPIRSKIGYHFVKRTGERAALGTMNVGQVLLATEPDAGPAQRSATAHIADSLYQAIKAGASFEDIARAFSNDRTSYQSGGQIPPVTVGQYDPAFEQAVFALSKDGEISRPVQTAFGFHILKRYSASPIETDRNKALSDMRARVNADGRKNIARERFEKNVIISTGLKESISDKSKVWIITDSSLLKKKDVTIGGISARSTLFQIKDRTVTVGDWLKFANAMFMNDAETPRKYAGYMDQFRNLSAVTYYSDHLEDYNEAYKAQLNEFRDGNLLFEVMERKIWNKASTDIPALRKHYEANKARYNWGPSVDAILINSVDSTTAAAAVKTLQTDPRKWREIAAVSGGNLQMDSGRYDIAQIRAQGAQQVTPGYASPIQVNANDRSAAASVVIATHNEPSPRTFEEARGMVINDYQQVLEDQWVAELKKKYPVKLDRAEWDRIRKP